VDGGLRKFGTITLAQALAPGARVARDGFEVDATFNDQINQNLDYFNDVPATAALYLDPDGTPLDVGSTFRNPDLAKTYDLLAKGGADAFYSGPLAARSWTHRRILRSRRTRTTLPARRHDDCRPCRIHRTSAPADTRQLRGLDVFSMGPPSSGARPSARR